MRDMKDVYVMGERGERGLCDRRDMKKCLCDRRDVRKRFM